MEEFYSAISNLWQSYSTPYMEPNLLDTVAKNLTVVQRGVTHVCYKKVLHDNDEGNCELFKRLGEEYPPIFDTMDVDFGGGLI